MNYPPLKFKVIKTPKLANKYDSLSRDILNAGANAVVSNIADYIMRRSSSWHKTANKFGVTPTCILEFKNTAKGRAESRGGGKIYKVARTGTADIRIANVPFIGKAFGDLHIRPKRAKWLTIPLCADAWQTPASQIASKGYSKTFVMKSKRTGKSLIIGDDNGQLVPLYVLLKSVTIKRDAKLLPTKHLCETWAKNAMRDELKKKKKGVA